MKKLRTDQKVKYAYSSAISKAKKRGFEWSISEEIYHSLVNKPCNYCNQIITGYGIRLDRLNNNLGYIESNVVPCCGDCNKIRNNILSPEEMIIAMKAIMEYRNIEHKIVALNPQSDSMMIK